MEVNDVINLSESVGVVVYDQYSKNSSFHIPVEDDFLWSLLGQQKVTLWSTDGRPVSPAEGEFGFNMTTQELEGWIEGEWVGTGWDGGDIDGGTF